MNFASIKPLFGGFILTLTICNTNAMEKPNHSMLERIGINNKLECKKPPFAVAVVDFGKLYEHSSFNPDLIIPRPIILPDKVSESEVEHGINVCSVIHQLHPLTEIYYYEDANSGHQGIETALKNDNVKIINCSFSQYSIPTRIFEEAQKLGKLLVFSGANCEGWLGLNARNRFFSELAQNENTKRSFVLIGGSEIKDNREEISNSFLKAGALRKNYLIGPGVNVSVFSHIPTKNSSKFVDGTSFAAPYIAASIIYLMTHNSDLTPFKAFKHLCKAANPPLVLSHASIADQGWGYLNLERALTNTNSKINILANNEFTKIYESHMKRPFIYSIKEILEKEYPLEIIKSLKLQDINDPHVKQLLRVSLYERGVFLLANGNLDEAIGCFEEAKSLGINHEDPLSSLSVKKELILDKLNNEDANQRWHKGMISMCHTWRTSKTQKKEDLDFSLLKKAHDFGYKEIDSIIGNQIFSKILIGDTLDIKLLKSWVADFRECTFSDKEKDDIYNSLSFQVKKIIENNFNIDIIKELLEIGSHFSTSDNKMPIQVILLSLMQECDKLLKKNCFDVNTKSMIHLMIDITQEHQDNALFLTNIESTLANKLADKTVNPEVMIDVLKSISTHSDFYYCSLSNYHLDIIEGLREKDPPQISDIIIQEYSEALNFAKDIKDDDVRKGYLSTCYGELGYYYLTCYKNNPEKSEPYVLNEAVTNLEIACEIDKEWLIDFVEAKARKFKANSFFSSWF